MPLTTIANMFGRSPLRSLQKHMERVRLCADTLKPFFDAVLASDWNRAIQLQESIATLEREADELKKDVRLHLPKSLFLPVPRGDLLEMLVKQDQIANKAKDIAGLIVGRQISFPDTITPLLKEFLARCLDASEQANMAIDELTVLLETGFRGNEVTLVENMIFELDLIEHDSDELQIRLRAQLAQVEKSLPPIDAVFLYKIIEWIGDLANKAQSVGGQLQLLLAH